MTAISWKISEITEQNLRDLADEAQCGIGWIREAYILLKDERQVRKVSGKLTLRTARDVLAVTVKRMQDDWDMSRMTVYADRVPVYLGRVTLTEIMEVDRLRSEMTHVLRNASGKNWANGVYEKKEWRNLKRPGIGWN